MRFIPIITMVGVIALVVAVGLSINAGITGHSIFNGNSAGDSNNVDNSNLNNLDVVDVPDFDYLDVIFDYNTTNIEENETKHHHNGDNIICTQNITNTTWTDWTNISCLSDDTMNQSRERTEYDINNCGTFSNVTYIEYRQTESCDFCTPNIVNDTWTSWSDITSCQANDTILQERSLIEYDNNFCGEVSNSTYYEYQETSCDYCTPNWVAYNTSCDGSEIIEYYLDLNNCYSQTGLVSDNNAPANVSYVCAPESCNFIDDDLDGEVDEIGCANLYGVVSDADAGLPVEGANISFYSQSTYDVYEDTGNYSALVPKTIPDAVTNSNGEYNISILEGDYHMVIQSSDEKDFNVKANKSNGNSHDVEIDENRGNNDFNAEGHILFSGESEYGEDNKYVCGDKLKFMMFGINHGASDEMITFVIQDHTINGNPSTSPIVYTGNISNSEESLVIHSGLKEHKIFEFEIPCSLSTVNEGRHDIHIIWNDEIFHKIGNFFVVSDITNPTINTDSSANGLPGEIITIGYSAFDQPQPGTVRELELSILEGPEETLNVIIDKDITDDSSGDGTANNDADYTVQGGNLDASLIYNQSGSYTARFIVIDGTGNLDSEDVDVTVYISEDEADDIATPIYSLFGINPPDFEYDWSGTIIGITRAWDRYDSFIEIGDEYITSGDLTNTEADSLNAIIDGCSGGLPYVKAISPMTAEDYNQTIYDYLYYLKCTCSRGLSGPSCIIL